MHRVQASSSFDHSGPLPPSLSLPPSLPPSETHLLREAFQGPAGRQGEEATSQALVQRLLVAREGGREGKRGA